MKLTSLLILILALSGCANFGDGLSDVGDAMKGDFRALGSAVPTTLATICKDFISNEVSGKKKWESRMLAINGKVTNISQTSGQFAVSFRDIKKNDHFGVAYTRDNLMANESKIENLKAGDPLKIMGVLVIDSYSRSGDRCSFRFEKARFQPIKVKKKAS